MLGSRAGPRHRRPRPGWHWGPEAHHPHLPRGERVNVGRSAARGGPVRPRPHRRRHAEPDRRAAPLDGDHRLLGPQGVPARRGRRLPVPGKHPEIGPAGRTPRCPPGPFVAVWSGCNCSAALPKAASASRVGDYQAVAFEEGSDEQCRRRSAGKSTGSTSPESRTASIDQVLKATAAIEALAKSSTSSIVGGGIVGAGSALRRRDTRPHCGHRRGEGLGVRHLIPIIEAHPRRTSGTSSMLDFGLVQEALHRARAADPAHRPAPGEALCAFLYPLTKP
jgi:hypothetical protein